MCVNLMDYGISLGRRFRALKLWFVIRHFGVEGLSVADPGAHPDCPTALGVDRRRRGIRANGRRSTSQRSSSATGPPAWPKKSWTSTTPEFSTAVNATREVYLSHTRVRGSYALRIAIGNIHTTEAHVRRRLRPGQRSAGTGIIAPFGMWQERRMLGGILSGAFPTLFSTNQGDP